MVGDRRDWMGKEEWSKMQILKKSLYTWEKKAMVETSLFAEDVVRKT